MRKRWMIWMVMFILTFSVPGHALESEEVLIEAETQTETILETQVETEIFEETEVETESVYVVETEEIIEKELKAVTNLKAATSSKGCVRLKWDAVEGADGYFVYRQIGKSKFEYQYMVSRTEYTDKTASQSEYNFYRVYPYYFNGQKNVIGPSNVYVYASGVLAREIDPVSNLKAVTVGKGKIKLTWNAVKGADGYIIYRQIGNTKFEYRYVVNKTDYTDTTASESEYCFYRVYPYYMNDFVRITGPSDTYVYAKGKYLQPVQNLSAKGIANKYIRLTWSSVEGAEGYIIYRQIGKGSFEYQYMVSKTNYTDTTASESEYNFYRVYPYYMDGQKRVVGPSNAYVYSKVVKRWIDPNKPMVALTFDDGPSVYTPRILDVLEKYNQAATFFVVGYNAARYGSTITRAYNLGCEIGNHTYNHPDLTTRSYNSIVNEMASVNSLIYNATGSYATVMRPPYGSHNSTVRSAMQVPLIMWSIDTLDWKTRNTWSTVNCVLNNVEDGDIVLMHDIHSPTISAVEILVPELVKRGYQLVTVSELAMYRGNGMKAGVAYHSFN